MKRPKAVMQPPMAAVKPTQATAAQEKKPRRVTSAAGLAAGFAGAGLAAAAGAGVRVSVCADAAPPAAWRSFVSSVMA